MYFMAAVKSKETQFKTSENPVKHETNCNVVFLEKNIFSNFSCMFLNPNNFSNMNFNCSNLLDMRNLQERVKKAFCYQKLF